MGTILEHGEKRGKKRKENNDTSGNCGQGCFGVLLLSLSAAAQTFGQLEISDKLLVNRGAEVLSIVNFAYLRSLFTHCHAAGYALPPGRVAGKSGCVPETRVCLPGPAGDAAIPFSFPE
ncbi:MAG: hypothetical protein LBD10_00180 [Desulfobulbus sp.]|jgi:hypothetical protein|uniref:hypothetical protein n=1 Tax=Desulfobulbus sp. TaxID=895 RepID=UPI00283E4ED8|nr:hypothetical protein [Desulfobulbus sp.]MDR2548621.1 hypothetical protein [Desulfobulbus sp.]